jgi:hypothetical protein
MVLRLMKLDLEDLLLVIMVHSTLVEILGTMVLMELVMTIFKYIKGL